MRQAAASNSNPRKRMSQQIENAENLPDGSADAALDNETVEELLGMQDKVRELGEQVSELRYNKGGAGSAQTQAQSIDKTALKEMEDRILNQVEQWNAHQEETLRQQAHEIEEFVSYNFPLLLQIFTLFILLGQTKLNAAIVALAERPQQKRPISFLREAPARQSVHC